MQSVESPKNLWKKLHLILSDVEYIKKDKANEFHRYRYASEEAIKKALHPLMAKHGVLLFLSVTDVIDTPIETSRGNKTMLTKAKIKYGFVDADTGETMNGEFYGVGEDASDKGLWKAITGAIKYILTTTFLIPTGDDAEADAPRGRQTKSYGTNAKQTATRKNEAGTTASPAAPSVSEPHSPAGRQPANTAARIKSLYALAKARGIASKEDAWKWITKETGVTIKDEAGFTGEALSFIENKLSELNDNPFYGEDTAETANV